MFYLGSYHNSHRQIEPELLRIIMKNWRLDDLLSSQSDNQKLINALKLIQQWSITGSLAVYEDFEISELLQFRLIYNLLVEETITGSENFLRKMLTPSKMNVNLPDDLYNLLVEFYNDIYESEFVTIADLIHKNSSSYQIIVRPKINQFGRIQISTEIFGSTLAPKYQKNSYIIAKFIQDDEKIEVYPGQVQFYFKHELPGRKQIHRFVFVK